MNRSEFSNLLLMERERKGKSLYFIQQRLGALYHQVKYIETGGHSFNIVKAIDYLKAIDSIIALSNGQNKFSIDDYDVFIDWLKNTRQEAMSQRLLAQKIGCSYAAIANAEVKKCIMSIDMFLKVIEALGYELKIVPK